MKGPLLTLTFLVLLHGTNARGAVSIMADVRPEYRDSVFWSDMMPTLDSASCAIFTNCRFMCNSDTLFMARHANQMALIDCEIWGHGEVRWSRFPEPSDRNYVMGLTMNGQDFVIEETSRQTIELEGLAVAAEFLKPVPEHATMLTLRLDTVRDGGLERFQVVALSDYVLPQGFLGWISSDERVRLEPVGNGMSCYVMTCDSSRFETQIDAYALNGVEAELLLTATNGRFQTGHEAVTSNLKETEKQRRGLFKRLFKRHRS